SLTLLVSLCCMLQASAQTYHVKRVPRDSLHIDGTGTSKMWERAQQLDDFVYPWDSAAAPSTTFAALWDGEWLFGIFGAKDDSVVVPFRHHSKMDVGASDRVEVFLKKDDAMDPYYCLEMDAAGRVLDYDATYYRKMNYAWAWPKGQLIIKASQVKDGYVLEFAISIRSLKELGLLQEGRLQAGLFRTECTGRTGGWSDLHWISWIRPQSHEPDFHIPSAFGTLVLEEAPAGGSSNEK
ncbi:MAG: carbohydrate-binding family 9-like protein, partial [Bacteroidota bacterium]